MKLTVRKEQPKDIEAIFNINKAAFETEAEAHLVDRLRQAQAMSLSLVAELEGQVVGHIAFSPITIDGFEHVELAGLAPMAVHPAHQNKGIGGELVQAGVKKLKTRGVSAVFVLGHPKYYLRFGFQPAFSTFGIKSEYDVSDETFMVKELESGALEDVVGLARYCREFDSL